MSLSSGSDITIPIQDSPPPPPSPYGNEKNGGHEKSKNARNSTNEPCSSTSNSPTGIENKAFQSSPEKTDKNHHPESKSNKEDHTNIAMGNGKENETSLNEAVNTDLVNMSILSTIPDKPQPQYGPYENFDEYFIPVNTHKKFLR